MTLNSRVMRLEATYAPPAGPDTCRQCGLLHALAATNIELIRQCIGVLPGPPPRLCLCECCHDGRWLARLSHGLQDEAEAAS